MPRIKYVDDKFNEQQLAIIEQANRFITDYAGQGYDLTLRQLYYRFVATDTFPDEWKRVRNEAGKLVYHEDGTTNNEQSYKKLGGIISRARCAGLVDWENMVDRTRSIEIPAAWESPAEIVEAVARQFNVDFWEGQSWRPEVWVEKDALIGVLETACAPWRCPYFSCRGYTSDSDIWRAAQRLRGYAKAGQTPIVFHLGDHDPSGIDMSRDITDRLKLFGRGKIEVKRLALSMDQVEEFSPPPNPAKETDSRFKDYRDEYGEESWELDALSPDTIGGLIREEMEAIIDTTVWAEAEERRDEGRRKLQALSDQWDDITGDL